MKDLAVHGEYVVVTATSPRAQYYAQAMTAAFAAGMEERGLDMASLPPATCARVCLLAMVCRAKAARHVTVLRAPRRGNGVLLATMMSMFSVSGGRCGRTVSLATCRWPSLPLMSPQTNVVMAHHLQAPRAAIGFAQGNIKAVLAQVRHTETMALQRSLTLFHLLANLHSFVENQTDPAQRGMFAQLLAAKLQKCSAPEAATTALPSIAATSSSRPPQHWAPSEAWVAPGQLPAAAAIADSRSGAHATNIVANALPAASVADVEKMGAQPGPIASGERWLQVSTNAPPLLMSSTQIVPSAVRSSTFLGLT